MGIKNEIEQNAKKNLRIETNKLEKAVDALIQEDWWEHQGMSYAAEPGRWDGAFFEVLNAAFRVYTTLSGFQNFVADNAKFATEPITDEMLQARRSRFVKNFTAHQGDDCGGFRPATAEGL